MNGESSSLWLVVAVVTGAVGTAMTVYGIRQKEALPLVFGIGIGIVPMLVSSGWVAALLSLAVGVIFVVVRKHL